MLLKLLIEKKFLEHSTKKNREKTQEEFRIKKVIKKKDNKLFAKWKGYSNSFKYINTLEFKKLDHIKQNVYLLKMN